MTKKKQFSVQKLFPDVIYILDVSLHSGLFFVCKAKRHLNKYKVGCYSSCCYARYRKNAKGSSRRLDPWKGSFQ
jgi:hypothetical protein